MRAVASLSKNKLSASTRALLGKDLKNVDNDNDSPNELQSLLEKEQKHYHAQCLQGLESILFAEEGEKAPAVLDWFTTMTEWCFAVVDGAKLPAETVETTMNIVDRYLLATCTCQSNGPSSRRSISLRPKDNSIFRSVSQFKLLVVTCLHIASKSSFSRSLSPTVLEALSKKEVQARDIETMEMKILSTVKFLVNPPTIVSYAKEIQKQLQLWSGDNEGAKEIFLLVVQRQARLAVTKLFPFYTSTSSVALACVKNALLVMEAQSLLDANCASLKSPSVQKAWRKLEKEIRRSSTWEKQEFRDVHYRLQYKLRTVARQTAYEWKQKNRDSDDSISTYPDESSMGFSISPSMEFSSSLSLTPVRELGKASS